MFLTFVLFPKFQIADDDDGPGNVGGAVHEHDVGAVSKSHRSSSARTKSRTGSLFRLETKIIYYKTMAVLPKK